MKRKVLVDVLGDVDELAVVVIACCASSEMVDVVVVCPSELTTTVGCDAWACVFHLVFIVHRCGNDSSSVLLC